MMMSGWLPPCPEGAADCRPDRFLLSVSSCTSSLAHLHASSLLQPFSVSRYNGFPESYSFFMVSQAGSLLGLMSTVARALNGHSW